MKMRTVCLIMTFAMCTLMCSCVCVNSFNKTRQCSTGESCECSVDSVRSEIYFGLQKPDGTSVTEAEWHDFLDKSITPRFPEGLTVFDSYGQSRDKNGKTLKEKTKVLVIVHKAGKAGDLDKICGEYKKAFSQESVFRASSRVSSSLDDDKGGDDCRCGKDEEHQD